jgi:outer membrane lipoprotein SlyB
MLRQRISSALYRIAAGVGCKVACPTFPEVGAFLGGSLLGGASLVLGGFTIEITAAQGAILGAAVGVEVQKELCKNCAT